MRTICSRGIGCMAAHKSSTQRASPPYCPAEHLQSSSATHTQVLRDVAHVLPAAPGLLSCALISMYACQDQLINLSWSAHLPLGKTGACQSRFSGRHRVSLGLLLHAPLVLSFLIREEHESLSLGWALGIRVIQQILHKHTASSLCYAITCCPNGGAPSKLDTRVAHKRQPLIAARCIRDKRTKEHRPEFPSGCS